MKNTKRLFAAVMALTLVSALSPVSALAAPPTINDPGISLGDVVIPGNTDTTPTTKTLDATTTSNSADVNYSVDPSYTVVIPAKIALSDTSTTNAQISLDETAKPFKLGKGQTLSVKVADVDTNDFKVKCDSVEVPYTVTAGTSTTALAKGSTAAEFTNDNKTAKSLTFSQIDASKATVAGDYTGTLTFSIAVEDAPSVTVNSINLNRSSLVLGAGRTDIVANALRATVNKTPDDAEVTVKWTSSKPEIASVDENGKITPLVIGETTITAEAGGKTATCNVEVVENKLTTINVQKRGGDCIDGVTFSYMPGDTYRQAANRNSNWDVYDAGSWGTIYYDNPSGDLYVNDGNYFPSLGYAIDDVVDPSASYSHNIEEEPEWWD